MEEALGIEAFLTDSGGIGGRLRADPEDFVVEEIPISLPVADEGRYTAVMLRARNWETNRLIRHLARRLGISRKRIRFAGTKDKRAVTNQLVQFDGPPEMLEELRVRDVEISDIIRTDKRLELGDLLGNRFRILISDIELPNRDTLERMSATTDFIIGVGGFPNFFGVQRFGAARPITHIVGKRICQGDFEGAVMTYIGHPYPTETEEVQAARRLVDSGVNLSDALRKFPKHMSFEKAILNHLVKRPGDYPGAIQSLPLNLQMMFVHAYQSYLFNKILSERLKRNLPIHEPVAGDVLLPARNNGLPDRAKRIEVNDDNMEKAIKRTREGKGFVSGVIVGTEPQYASGEMGEIEERVIESENVKFNDFLIPEIPRISSKGSRREILGPLKDFEFSIGDGSVTTTFSLIPGSYATSLLREFMKTDSMSY